MDYAEYRAKPTEPIHVEAIQFTVPDGKTLDEALETALDMLEGRGRIEVLEDGTKILALHYALDYFVDVNLGDYIIRGPYGFSHTPKATFEKVYEPLDAPPAPVKPKRVRRTNAQIAADKAAKEAGQ